MFSISLRSKLKLIESKVREWTGLVPTLEFFGCGVMRETPLDSSTLVQRNTFNVDI